MKKCPQCFYTRSWKLADGRHKCRQCGHRYRVRTVWQASRLPERTKQLLLERFVLGVPVYRQRFLADASLAAVERFYRLARACCAYEELLREPFEGHLECDETTFGGRKKGKRGWGTAGKIIVFGVLKRNGTVQVFPISRRSGQKVLRFIQAHTRPGSLYYTDDWQAYVALAVRGDYITVHKQDGVPKGRDHINGIEGFWSYAKHWLYPYRGVPRKFFHLYLGEVCYRFNHRHENLKPPVLSLMKHLNYNDIRPLLVRIR
ncbi:transposase [Methylohalomonas lacus]|uniref:Transposase n=1 Tax=Methylohalomonas lacus TaxID=398773 RepID=A0AAE3HIY4_9GAMM|nr:IS1595 family transposase [Methylohalomonas lacus]MCS3903120.1 transposase [Methylohalomonas lacus]